MSTTEYRFTCALANGFHARPASLLAEVARRFTAEVMLAKDPGGTPVNAASVLSVIGLDIKLGATCLLAARGPDAPEAIDALRDFIENRLVSADELPPPQPPDSHTTSKLPIGLRRMNVPHAFGRPACSGLGRGVAVIVEGLALPPELQTARPESPDAELAAARRAISSLHADLQTRSATATGLTRELLKAHSEIANDSALFAEIERAVKAGATAAQAVLAAADRFVAALRGAASEYIRDRATDVQDVCGQLLDRLTGGRLAVAEVSLARDSIVFAEALTPGQLLKIDRRFLRALVLGHVGATSHTVILARSFCIPTLINVTDAPKLAHAGRPVVVDGAGGYVITSVTPEVSRYFDREARTSVRRLEKLAPIARRPAITSDGTRLEIGANASTPNEVAAAIESGADGVGLLRTELLFLDRASAPTEEEQFQTYAATIRACAGRPVIIRTLDIGGDKPAAYLPMPREENPFLGVRGLRLYKKHPELLRTQLRAIARASAVGPVKIMAPMVATPAEAAWFREQVRNTQAELAATGTKFDSNMPVGIMIEIPAAAFVMDQLCDEVDFFSIGTNDLCQYLMAVDRVNPGVTALYNTRQPSFLRLLRTIVHAAKSRCKWIGMCGEMAGDRLNLPLMVGLGLDEISVSPGEILAIKTTVPRLDTPHSRAILESASNCRRTDEVESILRDAASAPGESAPIIADDLIEPFADSQSKEEAIKDAVDLLFLAGRTDHPRDVEEAVWTREETYSTGLGFGFAVPHCKTDAVRAPTLAVLKLPTPIEWGSTDGLPVRVVLLLAIPASDSSGAHMKVFAKLARRLMHDEFRDRLLNSTERSTIETTLKEELGIA